MSEQINEILRDVVDILKQYDRRMDRLEEEVHRLRAASGAFYGPGTKVEIHPVTDMNRACQPNLDEGGSPCRSI